MAKVQKGDQVRVHFAGRLPNGTTFDSSEECDPLEFEAGGDDVITGLSEAVIGMERGEAKRLIVPPEDGFGVRRAELEHEVPRAALPDDVSVGAQLEAHAGERVIPIWVKELDDEKATVDANHPLSGLELELEITLISIEPTA